MVAGFGPRKRSKCARVVTVLVLEVLVLAREVAWEPGPRAGVWAGETAEASPAAVRPDCGGEVPPGLEAAWGPMAGMACVVPCGGTEVAPAGVLPGFGGGVDSRLEAVWGPMTGMACVVPCGGTEVAPAGVLPGWGVGAGCPGSSCADRG